MAIRSITIETLRGVRGVTLESLPEVVLFGGRNNCGKTTLLEAFLLLAGHYSAKPLFEINRCRLVSSQTMEMMELLFDGKDRDFVSLRGEMETGERRECRYRFQVREHYELPTSMGGAPGLSPTVNEVVALFTGQLPGHPAETRQFAAYPNPSQDDRWVIEQTAWGALPIPHTFVPVAALETVDAEFLREVFKQGEDATLLEALRSVDARIEAVMMDKDRILAKVEGRKRPLPIQVLGSGMLHFITLFSAVACCKGGFVCIDEIGNGLHYSACQVLWNTLLPYAKKYHVQLFITTHRVDVLRSFAETLLALRDAPSAAYINLIRAPEAGVLEQYRYSPDKLLGALEAGMEVR